MESQSLNDSYISSEENDSHDDQSYEPPKRKKKKEEKQKKTNRYGDSKSHNDFFENLNKDSGNQTETRAQSPIDHVDLDSENDVAVNDSPGSSGQINPVQSQSQPNNLDFGTESNLVDLVKLLLRKVDAIEDFLIRLDVKIEYSSKIESTSKPSTLGTIDIDHMQEFGLPAESLSDLNKLEDSLQNDKEFKAKLCNLLQSIGGVDEKADGLKTLQKLMHFLISPKFIHSISWTGRGKGAERKVAFSGFIHLINLITITVNKADKTYRSKDVDQKLKYTIFKHAPTKFKNSQKDANSNDTSVPKETTQSVSITDAIIYKSDSNINTSNLHALPVNSPPNQLAAQVNSLNYPPLPSIELTQRPYQVLNPNLKTMSWHGPPYFYNM